MLRANKIYSFWILLRIAFGLFWICASEVVYSWFGQWRREWVDDWIQGWGRKSVKLLRLKWQLHNPHKVDFTAYKRCVLMFNHSSHLDIPLILAALPYTIRMLAKKELYKIPVFSKGLRLGEFPAIDRGNREQAMKDLQYAQELMESGVLINVFPQGTRTRDGTLGRLKKGGFYLAIEAQATIIPIGIRGMTEVLPADSLQLQLGQDVEIHVGEPIDAGDYTIKDKEGLIENVSNQLKALAAID